MQDTDPHIPIFLPHTPPFDTHTPLFDAQTPPLRLSLKELLSHAAI